MYFYAPVLFIHRQKNTVKRLSIRTTLFGFCEPVKQDYRGKGALFSFTLF